MKPRVRQNKPNDTKAQRHLQIKHFEKPHYFENNVEISATIRHTNIEGRHKIVGLRPERHTSAFRIYNTIWSLGFCVCTWSRKSAVWANTIWAPTSQVRSSSCPPRPQRLTLGNPGTELRDPVFAMCRESRFKIHLGLHLGLMYRRSDAKILGGTVHVSPKRVGQPIVEYVTHPWRIPFDSTAMNHADFSAFWKMNGTSFTPGYRSC